jgi:hypothetical protein
LSPEFFALSEFDLLFMVIFLVLAHCQVLLGSGLSPFTHQLARA